MPRRTIIRLLARLDSSPLPAADPIRLALEHELLTLLAEIAALSSTRARPS